MRAMRNVVAHEWFGTDREVLWETATQDVPTIVEPGDYLAMGDGTKGSHSGLFLAYNESRDRVWHIGGNESGAKVCRPDLHECGTAAVFIAWHPTDEQEDEDYYHNMVGLNWCMERR